MATAHRAKVNMMVCSKSMINIATKMEQRWDIPYFEGSFYGIGDMSDTLRQIAKLLVQTGAPADLTAIVRTLVKPLPVKSDQITLLPGSHCSRARLAAGGGPPVARDGRRTALLREHHQVGRAGHERHLG